MALLLQSIKMSGSVCALFESFHDLLRGVALHEDFLFEPIVLARIVKDSGS